MKTTRGVFSDGSTWAYAPSPGGGSGGYPWLSLDRGVRHERPCVTNSTDIEMAALLMQNYRANEREWGAGWQVMDMETFRECQRQAEERTYQDVNSASAFARIGTLMHEAASLQKQYLRELQQRLRDVEKRVKTLIGERNDARERLNHVHNYAQEKLAQRGVQIRELERQVSELTQRNADLNKARFRLGGGWFGVR